MKLESFMMMLVIAGLTHLAVAISLLVYCVFNFHLWPPLTAGYCTFMSTILLASFERLGELLDVQN